MGPKPIRFGALLYGLFAVEGVAVTGDGQVLVDSLTGTNAVYHPGNSASGKSWFSSTCTGADRSTFNPDSSQSWCELHGVGEETLADPAATAYQITGLQALNNRFYATGRKINEPAQVRLPSKLPGATYHFKRCNCKKTAKMASCSIWWCGPMDA